mgnify:CR=1 FL=1
MSADKVTSIDRHPSSGVPCDLAAERALLGAMLLSWDARRIAAASVASSEFYRPAHAAIFDAILAVVPPDETAFRARLEYLRNSACYCAPETMCTVWRRLSTTFVDRFGGKYPPPKGWPAQATEILTGRPL